MNAVNKKKLYRLLSIGGVGAVSFGCFGMLFLSQLIHYISKPSPSASTAGNIYVTRRGSAKQRAQCSMIFEVNGKQYESYAGCSWYGSGDKVTVIYKTDDPYKAVLDARNVGYTFGLAGLVLALITYLMIKNFQSSLKKDREISPPETSAGKS